MIRFLLLACLVFCINSQVFANEQGSVYFYTESSDGLDVVEEEIFFNSTFTTLEKNIILYENLFNPNNDLITCIPKGTEVIQMQFDEGHLKINVSSQIKNYGGNAQEEAILLQLTHTAFSIKEVELLSIYIDGYVDTLPEGSYIQNIRPLL